MSIESRFKTLLSDNKLTASAMADLIGVQASTLSHILGGRNKPSVDILIKLKTAFPDLDLDWFLMGEKTKPVHTNPSLFPSLDEDENAPESPHSKGIEFSSEVERVILFYSNGKFKEYSK